MERKREKIVKNGISLGGGYSRRFRASENQFEGVRNICYIYTPFPVFRCTLASHSYYYYFFSFFLLNIVSRDAILTDGIYVRDFCRD